MTDDRAKEELREALYMVKLVNEELREAGWSTTKIIQYWDDYADNKL